MKKCTLETILETQNSRVTNVGDEPLNHHTHHDCLRHTLYILSISITITWSLSPFLQGFTEDPLPLLKLGIALSTGLSAALLLPIRYLSIKEFQMLKRQRDLGLAMKESERRIQTHLNRLSALISVGNIMSTKNELKTIFDSITRISVEAFECSRSSLMLFDKDSRELIVQSASGDYGKNILDLRQSIDVGIAGWVARNEKALLLNNPEDITKYSDLEFKNPNISSSIVVPILIRNELVGVLNISSDSADTTYKKEDLYTLKIFAQHAGSCIKHAEHVNWMRQIYVPITKKLSIKDLTQRKAAMHDEHCSNDRPDYITPGINRKREL